MKNDKSTIFAGTGHVRHIASNALAARAICKPSTRTFLFRNLEAALNDHEARVRETRPQANGFHNPGAASTPKFTHNSRLDRNSWAPPTHETFRNLAKMTKDRLKINITSLKPLEASEASIDSNEPANSTRKRRKVVDARCRIEIAVYEFSVSKSSGKPVKRLGEEPLIKTVLEDANLQGCRRDDGRFHFDVDLVNPFTINLEQIQVPVERGGQVEMAMASRYEIMIKLRILKVDDARIVLEHIKGARAPVDGQLMMEPLVARWKSLPRCPEKPIRAEQVVRGKKAQTDYGFVVDMAWGWENSLKTSNSHLANFNELKRNLAAATLPTPLATPTPSQTNETPNIPFQLEYILPGHEVTVSGLRCILCQAREFSSLVRLRHHFETSHCNHQEVFKVTELGGSKVEILMENEARGRGSRKKRPSNPNSWSPGHEELWIAPPHPCDLERVVEGDVSWEESGIRPRKASTLNENVSVPSIKPKTPDEVIKALPIRRKKTFRVPLYPPNNDHGPRRYFSSSTHRVLEPGEELSESDDDIPMDWHMQKANNMIDADDDIPMKLKPFYKSIEAHFQKERTMADLFLGDSIIRWVHSDQAQLFFGDKEVLIAFGEWLSSFKKRISKEVFRYCINKAREASDSQAKTPTRRSPRKNRGKRKSTTVDSDFTDIDDIEELNATTGTEISSSDLTTDMTSTVGVDEDIQKKNQCICGIVPEFNTHRVLCDNPVS
jgi:hypothetical protein